PVGLRALERVMRGTDVSFELTELPWGCEYYLAHGRMMDEDGFERLRSFDAIYFGAIGDPRVPDTVTADLLLAIIRRFHQYVNLRPMRLVPGLTSPLAGRGSKDIDMICVRENSEGEYAPIGGRVHIGRSNEVAQQSAVFTRHGVERILRYAF